MAVTQYIGSRYVPLLADPVEWSNTKTYEPLTIVLHQGNSYTSRQFVPLGIDIANNEFWAMTGNYNAQIELYRREVSSLSEQVDTAISNVEDEIADVSTVNDAQPLIFENVAHMKASTLCKPGVYAITAGYATADDGGSALYKITNDIVTYDEGKYVKVGSFTAVCESVKIPYPNYIVNENTATLYNISNDISSLVANLLETYDIVYVPSGTYEINSTIDVPANKSVVFAGTYKDASIEKSVITTRNNVTLFKLHNHSKVQGGYFDLRNTLNTIVFKIDCSSEGVANLSLLDSTVIGGRESDGNLTQKGVYIECDNLNITEQGYLVYANFDLDIETVFCAYHFHRHHAAATASGVWLTNNYFNGYMRHCTRYIWNDFAQRGYSNNQCVYNAVIQAGSLISGETDYPGINVVGDNSRFNGQMWDFGGTHQSTGIKFELGATQNIVFVNTVIDPDGIATNVTYAKLIKNNYSGVREITYGEKIVDGSIHAVRVGQFLAIWGTFKTPTGLSVNDQICTILSSRVQALTYLNLYRSGASIGNASITSVSNPVIAASTEIPASNAWTYISAVLPLYDVTNT